MFQTKFVEKIKRSTLHNDSYTFMIAPRFLPRIKNVSDKICRENQNGYFTRRLLYIYDSSPISS
jgi:hypothetical protein